VYFIILVDDYLCYRHVYLLSLQALDVFKYFVAKTDSIVKKVREYLSDVFKEFCKENIYEDS